MTNCRLLRNSGPSLSFSELTIQSCEWLRSLHCIEIKPLHLLKRWLKRLSQPLLIDYSWRRPKALWHKLKLWRLRYLLGFNDRGPLLWISLQTWSDKELSDIVPLVSYSLLLLLTLTLKQRCSIASHCMTDACNMAIPPSLQLCLPEFWVLMKIEQLKQEDSHSERVRIWKVRTIGRYKKYQ